MKNIVITGDSLSYNRYSYDDLGRMNATDCFVGMDSWSFKLRKHLISSTKGFIYGDEIKIPEKKVLGIEDDERHSLCGKRVVTVSPENGEIHIKTHSESGKIALYFQARPKNYARFSLSVNKVFKCRVDTYGVPHIHQGYAPLCVELDCGKGEREITLSDFEATEFAPLVTVAGMSEEGISVNITGQGSRTAKFILYHIEERILAYSPDTVILIFGGNDVLYYPPEKYREYLEEIFARVKKDNPKCRIITVTIPPSAMPTYPVRGKVFTSQADFDEEIESFNRVLEEISSECIVTRKLFEGVCVKEWRHDSVHMTRLGNDMLFEKLLAIL